MFIANEPKNRHIIHSFEVLCPVLPWMFIEFSNINMFTTWCNDLNVPLFFSNCLLHSSSMTCGGSKVEGESSKGYV